MRRAVVDVGSNSVLLVVAEKRDNTWVPIVETSQVTGLGRGTKSTGTLSKEGIAATLNALETCFACANEAGAAKIVAAATMAARIAGNTEEFLSMATAQQTPVVVLSGEDEAELGFRSIAEDPEFSSNSLLSMVDVGGHSTEIAIARRSGERHETGFSRSFPIGTLALRSGTMQNESPGAMARMKAVQDIDDALAFSCLPGEAGRTVALGATATNLVTIREAITEWNPERVHGAFLDYEEIGRAVGWLCSMTDVERAAIPGLERGRESTIHIGALILERCLFALRVEGCFISVRGWRHALLEDDRWFAA